MVRTPSYLPANPWIEQAQRHGIPLSNSGKLLQAAMPKRMRVSTSQIIDRLLATDSGRDKIFQSIHKQPGERMVAVPQELCIGAINDEVGGVVRERCTRAYYMPLRKCLILFAWRRAIPDLYTMLREPKQPSPNLLEGVRRRLTLFSAVIQIPNSISDDLYCASRLGLVGTKMGAVAEKYGAMLWWTDTFLQLNVSAISESHNRAQLKKLQSRQEYLQQCLDDLTHGDTLKPEYAISDDTLGAFLRTDADIRKVQTGQSWARLSAFKLMCDFVFVSYDVFGFKKGKEGTQAIVGLTAGLLSSLKLWDKHYNSLAKPPSM
ncbi:hypothetical protein E3P92_00241 [Wallemia ichthyophaga]|nr:hypothetical protein E3P96_03622 [Wallemia ichthyophaga]TIB19034.1 hypothetical protein E3P92_00241 [Wallemia ichthyophaga]TIB37290.1 hypothetical protein E3P84_00403 [Wallemia ichthyophaga]TIB43834.1 hypothetical protein E3P83_00546 [Wallemia ichthyophaga]TIB69614.1 hypothetical protein E3P77_00414 [Wallemia ichthyophaga]